MYFSAEEEALSSSDPNFNTLKQPVFDGESVTWTQDQTSPKLVMNKSIASQVDTTVIERPDSLSSTNSTLSYMSADTDPDETMSGGVPEEFSMVDLHSQVSVLYDPFNFCQNKNHV
jgi:hypothetical protein